MGAACLYVTYNGLTDHIGQAQVLPYLTGLADRGHSFTVVSMERGARAQRYAKPLREAIAGRAVRLRPRAAREGRMFPSRALEQRDLYRAARQAWRAERFDFVHCRSYVPASIGLRLKRHEGARFIFDMRGFWVDQRIEGGRWNPRSPFYRALIHRWRGIESRAVAESDAIVVLTNAAKEIVQAMPSYRGAPIAVIPCAVSFDEFDLRPTRAAKRAELGFEDADTVLVYLGSLGTVYLLDEMLALFAALRSADPNARLLMLGKHDQADIQRSATRLEIPLANRDFRSLEVDREAVPDYLAAADIGLCFITSTKSSAGVSPTKLGEYLACGLPVVATPAIGDVEAILRQTGAGFVMKDLGGASRSAAVAFVEKSRRSDREAVRRASRGLLDLPVAIASYDGIYARLLHG